MTTHNVHIPWAQNISITNLLLQYAEGKFGKIVKSNRTFIVFSSGTICVIGGTTVIEFYDETPPDIDTDYVVYLVQSEKDAKTLFTYLRNDRGFWGQDFPE